MGYADEHYVLHETTHPPAPVWAPTPGVPIVARMLAYSFGALMLFTVILAFAGQPPPDIPASPASWHTYTSPTGFTLPYPTDWHLSEKDEGAEDGVVFELPPGDQVRVLAIPIDIPDGADPNEIDQSLASRLGEEFDAFVPTGTATTTAGDLHLFSFSASRKWRTHLMKGAWVTRVFPRCALVLIATAPEEGWPPMQTILTHMVEQAAYP